MKHNTTHIANKVSQKLKLIKKQEGNKFNKKSNKRKSLLKIGRYEKEEKLKNLNVKWEIVSNQIIKSKEKK